MEGFPDRAQWQSVFPKDDHNTISHSTRSSYTVTLAFLPTSGGVCDPDSLLNVGRSLWLPSPAIEVMLCDFQGQEKAVHIAPSACLLLKLRHHIVRKPKPAQAPWLQATVPLRSKLTASPNH